jgi:hypothetical protein
MVNQLSDAQIIAAITAAGWPSDQQVTAFAVIIAESGGNADARNSIGASGLMQILQSAHSELFTQYNWRDPVQNCKMGLIVYNQAGRSWRPWTTYTSGAYRAHLSRAQKAVGGHPIPPLTSGPLGPGVTAPSGTQGLSRVLVGLAGGALILIALVFLLKLERLIPAGKTLRIARKVMK